MPLALTIDWRVRGIGNGVVHMMILHWICSGASKIIRVTRLLSTFFPGNSQSCVSSRHHLFQQFITRLVHEPRVVLANDWPHHPVKRDISIKLYVPKAVLELLEHITCKRAGYDYYNRYRPWNISELHGLSTVTCSLLCTECRNRYYCDGLD